MRPARIASALVIATIAAGMLQAPSAAQELTAHAVVGAVEEGDTVPEDSVAPEPLIVPTPANVTVTTRASGEVVVTFDLPSGGAQVVRIQYSLDSGATWTTRNTSTGPLRIKGLTRGAQQSIVVRAVGKGGVKGDVSLPATFTVPFKPVVVEANGQVVRPGATIDAGAVVKLKDLPAQAKVDIRDRSRSGAAGVVAVSQRGRVAKSAPLPPKRTFEVRVTSQAGVEVAAMTLNTKDAPRFSFTVWPTQSNLGSGVPLVVSFSQPVRDRAAAERALQVTATKDFGKASWFWVNSSKAVFRPKAYWPGNTTVRLKADLSNVRGPEGTWGPDLVTSSFKTGDQVVLRVNLKTHSMKYVRNGATVKTIAISGGKAGWLTQSGTKILTAFIPHKRLYNPDPVNGWDVNVRWAIRVNDFGEYIHDATWNYRIGSANTSHGCTNLRYGDMGWLFSNTKFGDVAVYTGSSTRVGTKQYLSGYWNYSWAEWKRGSALFRG